MSQLASKTKELRQSVERSEGLPSSLADNSAAFSPWRSRALCSLFIFLIINLLALPFSHRTNHELTKSGILTSRYAIMQQGPWPWWIARAALLGSKADIAVMGDSQINAAIFQADAFTLKRPIDCASDRDIATIEQIVEKATRQNRRVINLAMGGAMASDQYLISQALLTKATPKIVVIAVSPRCFLDNTLLSASATEPFKFFEPYVAMGSLAHLAFPDLMSEAMWRLKCYVPLLNLHDQVCDSLKTTVKKSGSESSWSKLSNNAGQSITPRMLRGIYGSESDVKKGEILLSPMITPYFIDNTMEYKHRYRDTSARTYARQKQFFKAYLDTLTSMGIKTLVVGMPSLPTNRSLLPNQFWSDYRTWLTHECNQRGAVWFDLSEDPAFKQDYFLDTVHLNPFGARILIQKIAALLLTNPSLSQPLKPGSS